jgi:hypothetical protein
MVCVFHSAERKTGRSMAMANVAALLSRQSNRVVVADWNLEDPGLERLFLGASPATPQLPGLLELLVDYTEELSRPVAGEDDRLLLPTDAIERYLAPISTHPDTDRMWLMPAGRLDQAYSERVAAFDWDVFFGDLEGALLLERLRRRFGELADVTLIDATAGATPLSDACTSLIADVVVMFCPVGQRSLEMAARRAGQLADPQLVERRGGRPLELVVVPARIDYGEAGFLNEFKRSFLARFEPFVPPAIRDQPGAFWRLKIPDIPYFAYRSSIVFERPDDAIAEPLVEAYGRLAETLEALSAPGTSPDPAHETAGARTDDASDLDRFRALRLRRTETPSVFISYAREDEAVVSGLYESLKGFGFKAWIDTENLLGGEQWQQVIEEQIEISDLVLICLSRQSVAKKGHVQRELKKTLEVVDLQPEGTVYLIPVRLDDCEIPRSLGRFNWIDLFAPNGLVKLEESIRTAWRRSRASRV